MPDSIQDARLRELAFLTRLEREPSVSVTSEILFRDPGFRSMLVQLLREEYVNGLDIVPVQPGEDTGPACSIGWKAHLQFRAESRVWADIGNVLANQGTSVSISHKGRVRRSELEQRLRTGRDREPFGILWAERHRDEAVIMAVLTAQLSAPVSVCYLDMNGLKAINKHGHHAGDEAIRTYLQAIAMFVGEKGEGFRSGGSDEVVVVMRGAPVESAREAMRAMLKQLRKERVVVDEKEVAPFLTAACGIACTEDPTTDAALLVRRADDEQQRAKEASRATPGCSFLAVKGQEPEQVSL